jgi:hypothetical protein
MTPPSALALLLAAGLGLGLQPMSLAQAQPGEPRADSAAQQPPAAPAAASAAASRAMRALVQAQLDAFKAGDAARAYGYASPTIQQQFGSAERFMAMVLQAYPMLIAPRSLAWRLPEPTQGGAVLPLELRDATGRAWLATYELQRQADGSWRIAGCIVTPADPRLST